MADRDERTIHRLEAFSDIVIGFCLAELGLNLVIPNDEAGLSSLWPSLNAFAFSFVLISMLWWYHHKLFVGYLRLNPVTIVMNFVLLASLVFAVYFQQVAIHFMIHRVDPAVPERLWLASLAGIYGLLSLMYALGIWDRRQELDDSATRWGLHVIYQTVLGSAGLVSLCWAVPHNLTGFIATVVIVALASSLRGPVVALLIRYFLPTAAVANATPHPRNRG